MRLVVRTLEFYTCFPSGRVESYWQLLHKKSNHNVLRLSMMGDSTTALKCYWSESTCDNTFFVFKFLFWVCVLSIDFMWFVYLSPPWLKIIFLSREVSLNRNRGTYSALSLTTVMWKSWHMSTQAACSSSSTFSMRAMNMRATASRASGGHAVNLKP